MRGAEFVGPGVQVHRVLLDSGRPALLVNPERRLWLPWGRSPGEPGNWPLGGEVRWEALYRPAWSCWRPERVLLRPSRWLSDTGRWCELRLGFAMLAVKLTKAEGSPVYVVTLGQGAPKLVPRMPSIWEQKDARLADMDQAVQEQQRMNVLDRETRASAPADCAPLIAPPASPFDWESALPNNEAFRHWVQNGERITGLILGTTVYRQDGHRFVVMSGLYGLEGGPFWTFPLPEKYGDDPGLAAAALRNELCQKYRGQPSA